MQFTLSKLFLAVAMLALAFAGLVSRSYAWACIIVGVTALMYAIAAIRSFATSGSVRISAFAFLIVGSSYLLIPAVFPAMRLFLGTNCVLALACQYFFHDDYSVMQMIEVARTHFQIGSTNFIHNFFLIGNCVWSWLFATLAAWFAVRTYSKHRASE